MFMRRKLAKMEHRFLVRFVVDSKKSLWGTAFFKATKKSSKISAAAKSFLCVLVLHNFLVQLDVTTTMRLLLSAEKNFTNSVLLFSEKCALV